MTLELTTHSELAILVDALDSHIYWQLSDPFYRRDGYVDAPGSDTPEMAHEIAKCTRLRAELERKLDDFSRRRRSSLGSK